MSRLLAIDTATHACSAALWVDGEISSRFEIAPRRHTELILPMVDELLADGQLKLTDLDALAFGRGPGAFTGVRIAVGVAQGLAMGADLGVIGISDLAALARQGASQSGVQQIVAALDARMGEVYWGVYAVQAGDMQLIGSEAVSKPGVLGAAIGTGVTHCVGEGFRHYQAQLADLLRTRNQVGEALPHATDIVNLAHYALARGEAVAAEYALPVYLRDQVVKEAPATK